MKYLFLLLYPFILLSCGTNNPVKCTLTLADQNQKELMAVLDYYKNDTLKLQAASFLIENMWHGYSYAPIMDKYKQELMSASQMKLGLQDTIWLKLSENNKALSQSSKQFVYDAQTITADELIRNIDEAFRAWEESPWFVQVDFTAFCQYILPYRIKNEPLSDWITLLKEKYAPYIAGIKTPEEAFIVLYNKTLTEFKKGNNTYPYMPDVLMVDKAMKGSCDDRTLYLTAILRALAIPAVYDYIPFWANSSSTGHCWVSYIHNDSTFTLVDNADSFQFQIRSGKG